MFKAFLKSPLVVIATILVASTPTIICAQIITTATPPPTTYPTTTTPPPDLGHGEPCHNLTGPFCSWERGLICSPSTLLCECRPGSVFNSTNTTDSCRIFVGQPCRGSLPDLRCVEHAECGEELCECYHWPYTDAGNGYCMPSDGGPCDTKTDCNPVELLECNRGVCRCPNPLNQIVDGKCSNKIGSECQPADQIQCGRNSTCRSDPQSTTGFSCQCSANHIPDFEYQHCRIGHRLPCPKDNYMYDCSWDVGLSCLEGICQCQESPAQAWDEEGQVCGGIEGSLCTPYPEYPFKESPHILYCRTGLTCVQHSSLRSSGFGTCRQTQDKL